jgi:hypothetical protein
METITVKGIKLKAFVVGSSFNRQAQQFQNKIIDALGKLGVPEEQTYIPLEKFALRNAPAFAEWFMEGRRLYCSYSLSKNYVENLYVVSQIITTEVNAILSGKKEIYDFINEFTEDEDIVEQRKAARETLGLNEDEKDMVVINKKYKELAKAHHPDTPTGNVEKFKAVNKAHKTLRKELE